MKGRSSTFTSLKILFAFFSIVSQGQLLQAQQPISCTPITNPAPLYQQGGNLYLGHLPLPPQQNGYFYPLGTITPGEQHEGYVAGFHYTNDLDVEFRTSIQLPANGDIISALAINARVTATPSGATTSIDGVPLTNCTVVPNGYAGYSNKYGNIDDKNTIVFEVSRVDWFSGTGQQQLLVRSVHTDRTSSANARVTSCQTAVNISAPFASRDMDISFRLNPSAQGLEMYDFALAKTGLTLPENRSAVAVDGLDVVVAYLEAGYQNPAIQSVNPDLAAHLYFVIQLVGQDYYCGEPIVGATAILGYLAQSGLGIAWRQHAAGTLITLPYAIALAPAINGRLFYMNGTLE